jgi:DNA-binding NarL/FixJ family response regulator
MHIEEQDFLALMNAVKDLVGAVTTLSDKIKAKMADGSKAPHDFQKRFQGVFALHEQGFSIDEIAKKLDLDKGEIQLIFNISRRI